MPTAVAKILNDLGIEVLPLHTPAGDMQTHARQTMEAIARKHGEGHLIFTLRTIVESSARNQRALKAPILWAVSDLVATKPEWTRKGLAWLEAFDDIDLLALMARAQANRRAVSCGRASAPSCAIASRQPWEAWQRLGYGSASAYHTAPAA